MVAVNSGAAVSVEVRVLAGAGDDSYVCTDWTAQPSPAQVVEQPQNSDQDQYPSRAGSFFLGGVWLSYLLEQGGRAKQARR